MEIRICACPDCGSLNTRNWKRKIDMGFPELQKHLTAMTHEDQLDYLLLAQKCDDCGKFFYTKAKVEIQYMDEEDIVLQDFEAVYTGIK